MIRFSNRWQWYAPFSWQTLEVNARKENRKTHLCSPYDAAALVYVRPRARTTQKPAAPVRVNPPYGCMWLRYLRLKRSVSDIRKENSWMSLNSLRVLLHLHPQQVELSDWNCCCWYDPSLMIVSGSFGRTPDSTMCPIHQLMSPWQTL